jgi:hypothetical protein
LDVDRPAELAFRGDLGSVLASLPRLTSPGEARWLKAYVQAARGDFIRAEDTLRPLLSDSVADPATHARAAATLGSVLRQTNRHAEARRVERRALAVAPAGAARVHLLIGLAADAVGLGELREVDAVLGTIGTKPAGGWRTAVRLRWVRCERELLAGRPNDAAGHARRALAIAGRAKARRHVAKSHLFLGAALLEWADRDRSGRRGTARVAEARRSLRSARATARRIGARPIAEVADGLLRERR